MAKDLTLKELQDKILELQLQADLIIKVEKAGIIEEIKAKISQYGLTFEELGFKAPEPVIVYKRASSSPSSGSGKPPAVYFNKENHEEKWAGGKGRLPLWLKPHLDELKKKDSNADNTELKKWLDDNGYRIPVPVPVPVVVQEAPAVAEEKK